MSTELEKNETSAIVAVIEKCALNPNVDVAKMEKLLDLQERILNRNSKMAFMADMAMMQNELPEIEKNGAIKIHGKVQSRYAKFEDINEKIKPILKKFNFAVSFKIKQEATKIIITSILSHAMGHSEETEIELPHDNSGNKNSVQAVGSTISYGKRYTMCALLNISVRDEDDDAQIVDECASPAQQQVISRLVKDMPEESQDKFKKMYPELSQIKKNQVDSLIAKIKKTIGGQND